MALRQHQRIPESTTAVSPLTLHHNTGEVSTRLQNVLSQCQTEEDIRRELWDDFEIHRRSADTHLHRYLEHQHKVHAEGRPNRVHEIKDSEEEEATITGT